ncbi:MAG TPA: hypothetical protein PKD26_14105 [Pyrinomonadaceae bacterium]|nr:hypothetical protein [Pyrinomonadaceae bacterium]
MIDPLADTLRAAVNAAESTVASGGAAMSFIEMVLRRRPFWVAQQAAMEFARHSSTTAPIWRWVRVPGPNFVEVMRGTSTAATMQGITGLAVTMGIPIVTAVGVWVMLGSGYYQARQEVRRRGYMSGFSQGFTMGVLNWKWEQAVHLFAKRFVIRKNVFDPVMDREEALGYNEGLIKGWGTGSAVPDAFFDFSTGKVVDKRKSFRIALRKLAGRRDSGGWSRNADEARLQQSSYVIELAAAGLRHGLIVVE